MKILARFSSTLQFHVCCHLDMPAESLALSSSRHALCYGLLAFPNIALFLFKCSSIFHHAFYHSLFFVIEHVQRKLTTSLNLYYDVFLNKWAPS